MRWVLKVLAQAWVRKEDRRFITGKGRYVDDIKLQGMTYAHFVPQPARPCQGGKGHRFVGGE